MPNRKHIWRWELGQPSASNDIDELADEEPLEIRIGDRAISVTMRTPGHDAELAAGFLLTEGLVRSRADILEIQPCVRARDGNVITVHLSPETRVDLAKLTRHVFMSSSCGVCGKASIDAVRQQFSPVEKTASIVEAATILKLPDKLRESQATFSRTGGLHAAGIFDPAGNLVVLREDVGRHNAVDKVIGYGLLNGLLPFDRHILMVSGRASFEIMQKSLAARIPIVAAVSAPSSLAMDFASESNQTLIGFLRGTRMNVYTRPERVRFA